MAPCAEFALETAARRSEMLAAEWKHYDPEVGTIWLPVAKNGKGRFLLLTIRAQEIVESLRGRGEGGRIFKVDRDALVTAYRRARAMAQMDHWRWHDFRYEAISRACEGDMTDMELMDFSGHLDVKSLRRYRHPRPEIMVPVFARLKLRVAESRRCGLWREPRGAAQAAASSSSRSVEKALGSRFLRGRPCGRSIRE
nr:tyrosine-type recombinase/integrase [Hansschlegelia beijingensis]